MRKEMLLSFRGAEPFFCHSEERSLSSVILRSGATKNLLSGVERSFAALRMTKLDVILRSGATKNLLSGWKDPSLRSG